MCFRIIIGSIINRAWGGHEWIRFYQMLVYDACNKNGGLVFVVLKLLVSGDVCVEDVVVGNNVCERLGRVSSLGVIILSNINH
jgi:hypothetical protein